MINAGIVGCCEEESHISFPIDVTAETIGDNTYNSWIIVNTVGTPLSVGSGWLYASVNPDNNGYAYRTMNNLEANATYRVTFGTLYVIATEDRGGNPRLSWKEHNSGEGWESQIPNINPGNTTQNFTFSTGSTPIGELRMSIIPFRGEIDAEFTDTLKVERIA